MTTTVSPRARLATRGVGVLLTLPLLTAVVLYIAHLFGGAYALAFFVAAVTSLGVGGVLTLLVLPVTVYAMRRSIPGRMLAMTASVLNVPGLVLGLLWFWYSASEGLLW